MIYEIREHSDVSDLQFSNAANIISSEHASELINTRIKKEERKREKKINLREREREKERKRERKRERGGRGGREKKPGVSNDS